MLEVLLEVRDDLCCVDRFTGPSAGAPSLELGVGADSNHLGADLNVAQSAVFGGRDDGRAVVLCLRLKL